MSAKNLLKIIKKSLKLICFLDSNIFFELINEPNFILEIYQLILQVSFWFYPPGSTLVPVHGLKTAIKKHPYFDNILDYLSDIIKNAIAPQQIPEILVFANLKTLKKIKILSNVIILIINELESIIKNSNDINLFQTISLNYDLVLNLRLDLTNSKTKLIHNNLLRKNKGSFYTPDALINNINNFILDNKLNDINYSSIKILDPACGNGQILLNLAKAFKNKEINNYQEFLKNSFFGFDIDEIAIELCCLNFWLLLQNINLPLNFFQSNFIVADSLIQNPFNHKFDIIISNPPFGNAIEKKTGRNKAQNILYKEKFPEISIGSYDKANLFVYNSVKNLLTENGIYIFILPKAFLSVKSAINLQDYLTQNAAPETIIIPQNNRLFQRAIIFTIIIQGRKTKIQPIHELKIINDINNIDNINVKKIKVTTPWWQYCNENSYSEINGSDFYTLSDIANVKAGLSTKAAYELLPLIEDNKEGSNLKLLSTGLIDINKNFWGKKELRYLGHNFKYPRSPKLETIKSSSLYNSLSYQIQPKIILAGLTKRIEAYLDTDSEYAGLVQTFIIASDKIDLKLLLYILHSPAYFLYYHKYFGGKEIGGGKYFTIGKQELLKSLIPKSLIDNINDIEKEPNLNDKISSFYKITDISRLNNWYYN